MIGSQTKAKDFYLSFINNHGKKKVTASWEQITKEKNYPTRTISNDSPLHGNEVEDYFVYPNGIYPDVNDIVPDEEDSDFDVEKKLDVFNIKTLDIMETKRFVPADRMMSVLPDEVVSNNNQSKKDKSIDKNCRNTNSNHEYSNPEIKNRVEQVPENIKVENNIKTPAQNIIDPEPKTSQKNHSVERTETLFSLLNIYKETKDRASQLNQFPKEILAEIAKDSKKEIEKFLRQVYLLQSLITDIGNVTKIRYELDSLDGKQDSLSPDQNFNTKNTEKDLYKTETVKFNRFNSRNNMMKTFCHGQDKNKNV